MIYSKKFLYLSVFIFLYGNSIISATNFTVQVINDGIEDEAHPKSGRVIFQVSFKDNDQTVGQTMINMSGWPKKHTGWKVTVPSSLERRYTSVCYTFQLDTGERLSETGGIVVNQTFVASHLTDITAYLKSTTDTVLVGGLLSSPAPQEQTLTDVKRVYYVNFQ